MALEIIALFLVLALVAYLVGARGTAGFPMEVARLFIVLFLVLAIVAWFAAA